MAPFSPPPHASLIFFSIPPSLHHILFFSATGLKWCNVCILPCPSPLFPSSTSTSLSSISSYCLHLYLSLTLPLSFSFLPFPCLSLLPSPTVLPFQISNNPPFLYPSLTFSYCSIHNSSSNFFPISQFSFSISFCVFHAFSHHHPLNTYLSPLFSLPLSHFTFLILPSTLPSSPCPPIEHPFYLSLFLITLFLITFLSLLVFFCISLCCFLSFRPSVSLTLSPSLL